MQKQGVVLAEKCEAALARELLPLASELRGYDVVDLIAFSRLRREKSLNELVQSAVEHYFAPGSIEVLDTGEVHVNWGRAPEIELNFKFQSSPLQLYFRILLRETQASIGIEFIDCPKSWSSDSEYLASLIKSTVREARLWNARLC